MRSQSVEARFNVLKRSNKSSIMLFLTVTGDRIQDIFCWNKLTKIMRKVRSLVNTHSIIRVRHFHKWNTSQRLISKYMKIYDINGIICFFFFKFCKIIMSYEYVTLSKHFELEYILILLFTLWCNSKISLQILGNTSLIDLILSKYLTLDFTKCLLWHLQLSALFVYD